MAYEVRDNLLSAGYDTDPAFQQKYRGTRVLPQSD
jgi:hypothetical protein